MTLPDFAKINSSFLDNHYSQVINSFFPDLILYTVINIDIQREPYQFVVQL